MDALVVGLPRSGTTLIANLMHNPAEHRICLVEPLLNGETGCLKRKAGADLKHILKTPWLGKGKRVWGPRAHVSLADAAATIPPAYKWGIKEVRGDRMRYAYEHGKPKMVIFVIRDLRDLMLSSYNHAGGRIGVEGKVKAVKEFLEFHAKVSHDYQQEMDTFFYGKLWLLKRDGQLYISFSETDTWPLNGDQNRDLVAYGRAGEVRRGFKPRIENPLYPEEVLEIVRQCPEYQDQFGYEKEEV